LFCILGGGSDGARRCAAYSQQRAAYACNWYVVDPGGLFRAMRDFGAGTDEDAPGKFDLGESGVATHSIPPRSAFKVPSL